MAQRKKIKSDSDTHTILVSMHMGLVDNKTNIQYDQTYPLRQNEAPTVTPRNIFSNVSPQLV